MSGFGLATAARYMNPEGPGEIWGLLLLAHLHINRISVNFAQGDLASGTRPGLLAESLTARRHWSILPKFQIVPGRLSTMRLAGVAQFRRRR